MANKKTLLHTYSFNDATLAGKPFTQWAAQAVFLSDTPNRGIVVLLSLSRRLPHSRHRPPRRRASHHAIWSSATRRRSRPPTQRIGHCASPPPALRTAPLPRERYSRPRRHQQPLSRASRGSQSIAPAPRAMNGTAQQPQQEWSRPPEQLDQMAQISSDLDDLGNLFEFGDIDLNPISTVDSAHYGDHMQHQGTHPNTPFDEINEAQAISGSSAQDFGSHGQFGISQNVEQQHHFDGRPQTSHPYPQDPMYQSALQNQQHPYYTNQQFQFQALQGFPPNQVPPTPNSFGMHGEQGPFMQQQMDPQQRAILEQRYHMSKDNSVRNVTTCSPQSWLTLRQIALTPMASPAGTPQYNVQPEFTIPGAYFSPLTSPILPPQNGQSGAHHHQGYYTNPSTAPSSNATSPLDPNADVDMGGDDMQDSVISQAKKSKKSNKKKTATPRSAGPLARVKDSPIQKAIKRKSGTMLSSLAPPKESDTAPPRSSSTQPQSAGLQMPRHDSSENGSISPEPLSEALMGPPPRPGSSLNQSPAMSALHKDGASGLGKAATPKSLLSMRGDQQKGANQRREQQQADGIDNDQMEFEELQLPAAAADDSASRPPLPQINTQIQQSNSNDDTPRLTARKTPKLGPSSTPSSARPSSSMASPLVVGSPMTASTPGALLKDRKQDLKGGKTSKKRGSMSGTGSALVSPALRPRISPSIKPLLPEGGKCILKLCTTHLLT